MYFDVFITFMNLFRGVSIKKRMDFFLSRVEKIGVHPILIKVINRPLKKDIWKISKNVITLFKNLKSDEFSSIEGLVGVGKTHLFYMLRQLFSDYIFIPEPTFMLYDNIKDVTHYMDEFKNGFLTNKEEGFKFTHIIFERAPGSFKQYMDVHNEVLSNITYKTPFFVFMVLSNTRRTKLDETEIKSFSINVDKFLEFKDKSYCIEIESIKHSL
ncbi:MAG: hypothetical protein ACRC0V_00770 [Fusobacteriaceae bacterium]